LSKSKVLFSSALQENFGYSVLEASAYNCNLLLPNRLVYPEFYSKECLYANLGQAVKMLYKKLNKCEKSVRFALKNNDNVKKIVKMV